jgi:lysophospholipase L1-like esterase
MLRLLLVSTFLLIHQTVVHAADTFFLKDGQRVVFLGDSNTFAGHYIAYLDAYLYTRFPDKKFELLNLGLPSETVSGLSEPDHPYPRPCVFDRLDRVLEKTKPDVVVACYGMNDGIYHPFSEERFKKYQEGIQLLITRVEKAKAKIVLMTPPPFEGPAIKDKLLPKTAEKFSWLKPYEEYDSVLGRYSEWLLTLRDKGTMVVDVHAAINKHLETVHAADAKYCLTGDGIHPGGTGHWLITQQILLSWKAPKDVDQVEINAETAKAIRGQVSDLKIGRDEIRFSWLSTVPMPYDPSWDGKLAERERIAAQLNLYRLKITGMAGDRFELLEGKESLGRDDFSRKQLAEGVDLLTLKELSTNRRSAELWKLVAERQRFLGLAWLTDVGHKRPDTPKGIALEEAQKKAAELEKLIRKLAEPEKITLTLHFLYRGKEPVSQPARSAREGRPR